MLSTKVVRAIAAFERAVENRAFIGTIHPDDQEVIEHNYVKARAALERLLENV